MRDAQTLLPSIRYTSLSLCPTLRGPALFNSPARDATRRSGRARGQQARRAQARHALPLSRLQEPLERAAFSLSLRGAPQASQEGAGSRAGEVGGEERLVRLRGATLTVDSLRSGWCPPSPATGDPLHHLIDVRDSGRVL